MTFFEQWIECVYKNLFSLPRDIKLLVLTFLPETNIKFYSTTFQNVSETTLSYEMIQMSKFLIDLSSQHNQRLTKNLDDLKNHIDYFDRYHFNQSLTQYGLIFEGYHMIGIAHEMDMRNDFQYFKYYLITVLYRCCQEL